MHPAGDLEALLVELLDHPPRIREFIRIELEIPIGGLPLVIDFQHLVRKDVGDDLVGEIEHGFFIDGIFILRPCRPDGCAEEFRRLPLEEYRDKMAGGWIGQMVGVGWGGRPSSSG